VPRSQAECGTGHMRRTHDVLGATDTRHRLAGGANASRRADARKAPLRGRSAANRAQHQRSETRRRFADGATAPLGSSTRTVRKSSNAGSRVEQFAMSCCSQQKAQLVGMGEMRVFVDRVAGGQPGILLQPRHEWDLAQTGQFTQAFENGWLSISSRHPGKSAQRGQGVGPALRVSSKFWTLNPDVRAIIYPHGTGVFQVSRLGE